MSKRIREIPYHLFRILCPDCLHPIIIWDIYTSQKRTIRFHGFCGVCLDSNHKPGKVVDLSYKTGVIDEKKSQRLRLAWSARIRDGRHL